MMNISEKLIAEKLITETPHQTIALGSLLSDPSFLMEIGMLLGVATYLLIVACSHFSSFFILRRLVVVPSNHVWKPADLSSQRINRRKRLVVGSAKEFKRRSRRLSTGQVMYTPAAQLEA